MFLQQFDYLSQFHLLPLTVTVFSMPILHAREWDTYMCVTCVLHGAYYGSVDIPVVIIHPKRVLTVLAFLDADLCTQTADDAHSVL